ncbi:MAG: thymidine phosphorylase [Ignavibacteriaceae bacterium]|jgi:pyrimidine-nucleoside phosphorylase|nr:thymidine phosphorylase [Ignavibacteriaceae bacterium]
MNIVELIKKKRDGKSFTADEISFLIDQFTKGIIPDYQFSALLMSILLKGMNDSETSALTNSMLNSGKIIDLSSLKGKKVDKHSTGGVGDKTSLIIAPIVASTGIYVPMISGRGLGHTGGTLDKLESIPGFRTDLSLSESMKVLKKCGAVLIGQTKEIAPADKMIYALRDVTATVESIPLITASIMSKKLAEGIDGLVLDIKTGNGAFMKNHSDSIELANSLINAAKSFDKKVIAFITDMNQPLGNYVGNWLEVYESIQVLKGIVKNDLYTLSVKLAGAMIFLGKKAKSLQAGEQIAKDKIENGEAFRKFIEIVELQGGNINYINNPDKYPKAKYSRRVLSIKSSFVKEINTYQFGMASLELGAGRRTKENKIDFKAGIIINKKIGDYIKKDELICEIFSDSKTKINTAEQMIINSIKFSRTKPSIPKLIKKVIL